MAIFRCQIHVMVGEGENWTFSDHFLLEFNIGSPSTGRTMTILFNFFYFPGRE